MFGQICSDTKMNCTKSSHGGRDIDSRHIPKEKKKMHKIGIFGHENFYEVIKFTKITFQTKGQNFG